MNIQKYRGKKERTVIGAISGTSCDGVDVVIIKISGCLSDTRIEIINGKTYPFPPGLRSKILSLIKEGRADLPVISFLNFQLGQIFADSILALLKETGLSPGEVDLVGSHGQTIWHSPPGGSSPDNDYNSTWQIGESAVIAEKTGIMTVSDFRTADVASGGHGAPLVPYADYLLFSHPQENRIIANIGGIANITILPAGCTMDEVIAFDTGPGNMLIDEAVDEIIEKQNKSSERYDTDGRLAARGKVDKKLLNELLSHPFIEKKPPKSTGREEFGIEYYLELREKNPDINPIDFITTITAFTAESLAIAARKYFIPDTAIFSGGGIHNKTLMKFICDLLPETKVTDTSAFGIDPDLKEAVAFAILGNETIMGNPGNLPSATGASRPVILGKICGERAL
ncbi:MAG: anhydro-N-acetylmuramic acid kinase [Candidatus Eremiobacteraeota bacterium]|nr:anhydro-N-acetylmuramic acid kinase [Candidatus Eremiobacteraeota bacterium]